MQPARLIKRSVAQISHGLNQAAASTRFKPPSDSLCCRRPSACTKPTIDQGLDYPDTRISEHTDLYHGEAVSDPYRWLEDDLSTETKGWIERQNDTTFGYLADILLETN